MLKQKQYTVHFICRGNTFRSRLAAAYFAELAGGKFLVTSSGIGAKHTAIKTAETYTKSVAKQRKLQHGLHDRPLQTTAALLDNADVLVFLNKDIYDEALREYRFDPRKALVWHVADIDPVFKKRERSAHNEAALNAFAETTFASIERHCRQLLQYLTHTAWVDVMTTDNQFTGLRLPMAWVQDRGLWHRGVHVVVRTYDGKFVVGKRVNTIVFSPGMLEISLGGGVNAHETPLQAAQRETLEEFGVELDEKQFRPLFLHRLYGYHPHYRKQTRCHLYVYTATLPVHSQHLQPQPEEVADVRLLSPRQVKHLLNTHRLTSFGRLSTKYKLYQKAVAYSAHPY